MVVWKRLSSEYILRVKIQSKIQLKTEFFFLILQICKNILMLNFILKIKNMAFTFIILEMLGKHQCFIYNAPIIFYV